MRRALSQPEVDRLERESQLPVEGTWGALNRNDYPTLNAPSPDCGGAQLEKSVVLAQIERAEDEGNHAMAKALRTLLPLFIDEPEGVM